MIKSRWARSLCRRVWVAALFVSFSARAGANEHRGDADPTVFAIRLKNIFAATPEAKNFDDDLFENPLMREVINDPELFLRQIESYLVSGPGVPRAESRLSLISLQCLPMPDYLALLERLSVVPAGRLSKWVLFYAVSPGFESSTRLATSYKSKNVRDTLHRVGRSPNADENTRGAIKEIVDGIAYRYIEDEKVIPLLRCKKR